MIKEYIEKAENILLEEFSVLPFRSNIIYYDNLQTFLHKNGLNTKGESAYTPKDLTAHLPKGNLEDILPLVYHEYHGHGTFCEFSMYGQKLVANERIYDRLDYEQKIKFVPKAQEYFEAVKPYFEGFAIWTEEFLLTKSGKKDLWKLRKEKSKAMPLDFQHSYFEAYSMLKNYEKRKGTDALWRKVGFFGGKK
ncbi:MAG: hypothetical protein KKD12_06005 [Proteobacteria bacterium]|nr:hypothetical protein [Pseudomonadota bacterium]